MLDSATLAVGLAPALGPQLAVTDNEAFPAGDLLAPEDVFLAALVALEADDIGNDHFL
jgi:hypothetical protein